MAYNDSSEFDFVSELINFAKIQGRGDRATIDDIDLVVGIYSGMTPNHPISLRHDLEYSFGYSGHSLLPVLLGSIQVGNQTTSASLSQFPGVNALRIAQTNLALSSSLLQPGSQGDEVSQLQTSLAQLGFYNDSIDGLYGSTTAQAVKVFQQAKGLPADGIVGPQTQQVLALALSPQDLVSALVVLPPDILAFTPLLVASPPTPPSAWWLLVMPLIPLIGGGLTYLQHQHQAKRLSRQKSSLRQR